MAGRGFLKSRLAKLAAKESEESPNTAESKTGDESIQKVQIPVVSTETLIAGQQQAVRGRRVITITFSHK